MTHPGGGETIRRWCRRRNGKDDAIWKANVPVRGEREKIHGVASFLHLESAWFSTKDVQWRETQKEPHPAMNKKSRYRNRKKERTGLAQHRRPSSVFFAATTTPVCSKSILDGIGLFSGTSFDDISQILISMELGWNFICFCSNSTRAWRDNGRF